MPLYSRCRTDGRWYFLLCVPVVALLVPTYLRTQPSWGGIPFFYWYQMLMIPISAGLTWIVYRKTREREQ